MGQISQNILQYFLKALIATGYQLFILLGPLLILAFIMHFISKMSENLSYKVFGRTIYLYGFGWLGTSVHEIGHALFAILFGHTINEIVLFSPNGASGSLGHVNHSYNKKNIYQIIGNLFIGIGPILLGSLTLLLITYLLFQCNISNFSVPFSFESFLHLHSCKSLLIDLGRNMYTFFTVVIKGSTSVWWKIVLFCYFLYAIGSSITLSPSDINGAFKGFVFFVLFLFLFNVFTIWIGTFIQELFTKVSLYFSLLYFLIIVNIIVNILFIIVLLILNFIKSFFIR